MLTSTRALLLAALCTCGAAGAQGVFTDSEIGIKIKPPSKWVYLGCEGDMGSARAVFCADAPLAPREGSPHTPIMRLLFFSKEKVQDASARKPELPMRTPYTDFDDYLKRVYGPDTEEKNVVVATHGKFDGRMITATAGKEGVLTLYTFLVELEGGHVAIELETMTEHHKKVKPAFEGSLSSLAPVTAKGIVEAPAPQWESEYAAWRERPLAERSKERAQYAAEFLKTRQARKEPGWKIEKYKKGAPFLVVTRASAKATPRIVAAATLAHTWVEQHCADISDDTAMPAVLRIFADPNEQSVYRQRETSPSPYHAGRREIYFSENANQGTTGTGYGRLVRGVFEYYVHDKGGPEVIKNQPRWFNLGMAELFDNSRAKAKALELFPSETETGRFAYYAQHDQPIPALWSLIDESIQPAPTEPNEKGTWEEEDWKYVTECSRFFRWLDAGGNELMGEKNFMAEYLRAIGTVGATHAPNPAENVDARLLDDTQGDELLKKQYAWRAAFLQQVNTEALKHWGAGWQDAWQKANDAWQQFNRDFKP